jgi:hypothetical protein
MLAKRSATVWRDKLQEGIKNCYRNNDIHASGERERKNEKTIVMTQPMVEISVDDDDDDNNKDDYDIDYDDGFTDSFEQAKSAKA